MALCLLDVVPAPESNPEFCEDHMNGPALENGESFFNSPLLDPTPNSALSDWRQSVYMVQISLRLTGL